MTITKSITILMSLSLLIATSKSILPLMLILTITFLIPIITPILTINVGVHSYIDHTDGHPRLAAPHGRHAGRYLRENCQGKDKGLWWKNRGHDHFLIFRFVKNVL